MRLTQSLKKEKHPEINPEKTTYRDPSKSRKENPQKLTQLSSRSHQDTSWEKGQHKKTTP